MYRSMDTYNSSQIPPMHGGCGRIAYHVTFVGYLATVAIIIWLTTV